MELSKNKKGIDFITNVWESVAKIKDAAFISIKARKLKKEAKDTISDLVRQIENDTELFQDNFEKMAVDSVNYTFKDFKEIQKRILLNEKDLEISKITYKKLFNEDYE